jgi:hypothetical protein
MKPENCRDCERYSPENAIHGICEELGDRTYQAGTHDDCPLQSEPEAVNHPAHYNHYPVEVIDMMERVFGKEAVYHFCLLNAYKYRMRAGEKGDAAQDLEKERWYLNEAKKYGQ